jgi:ABC-type thiamin/hydroxymethylpyrimidine transport system permease subunit
MEKDVETMSAIVLPPIIQAKPSFGAPCNGCGLCCAEEVCGIGKIVHGDIQGPCPSLMFVGDRFRCAVVMTELVAGMPPKIAEALGIGKGCDANDLERWRGR